MYMHLLPTSDQHLVLMVVFVARRVGPQYAAGWFLSTYGPKLKLWLATSRALQKQGLPSRVFEAIEVQQ